MLRDLLGLIRGYGITALNLGGSKGELGGNEDKAGVYFGVGFSDLLRLQKEMSSERERERQRGGGRRSGASGRGTIGFALFQFCFRCDGPIKIDRRLTLGFFLCSSILAIYSLDSACEEEESLQGYVLLS